MKQIIKLDKKSGIRYLYINSKRTNSYIVPWINDNGYACFICGQLSIVHETLTKAKKYVFACG